MARVDEDQRIIYFLANKDGPTQRHIYAVSLDGGPIRRVTTAPGTHSVLIDHGARNFVDTHSSATQQAVITVHRLADDSTVADIHRQGDPTVSRLGLEAPRLVTLKARDGVTLYGTVYRPPAPFVAPYPTIVSVYGGPGVQLVTDA